MTINEAVSLVDRMRPNQFDFETKVKWLSKLDGMVFREILQTHEGNTVESFTGYSSAETETELLIPYPYDEDIYGYFLQAQIDSENGEMAKYNQSITMYNGAFKLFQDWYNRTHLPLPKKTAFIF